MVGDRALRAAQPAGDGLVPETLEHQRHHLALCRREELDARVGRLVLFEHQHPAAVVLDEPQRLKNARTRRVTLPVVLRMLQQVDRARQVRCEQRGTHAEGVADVLAPEYRPAWRVMATGQIHRVRPQIQFVRLGLPDLDTGCTRELGGSALDAAAPAPRRAKSVELLEAH
jgi:hypothetical protein